MRFGAWFGIAAVVLLVVGPFLNRNFGVADSLSTMPLSAVWEVAPVAVLVSLTYLLLLVSAALLSAILITTSLVIRRSESEDQAGQSLNAKGPLSGTRNRYSARG